MITGPIKNQIDRIWDAFWSGGISNPLEVMEQITYLLFIRRLDDLHTLEENKANRLRQPMARRIFPEGRDAKGRPFEDYRWSRFKHFAPAEIYGEIIGFARNRRFCYAPYIAALFNEAGPGSGLDEARPQHR
ncbi:type I restriction-modification system subunit M N-terminal domain-containing protein [Methylococcus geothermalis]|uniref:N6 adenine-specific DNA methyltransferase N-terminal domain-containing protein n=1 Tax=Methylococcus geothermalis TaxID=2681310 RepID=A0A858QAF8_9GAMM|nr:type I restriction-modification system subunit M N-terminal domain-containing protein [Methylococcus geothermalis]QJD30820.1 hypothetical protein GNH96_13155 [Methylococcus geothermalis]